MSLALATKTVHRNLRNKNLIINVTPTGNYVAGGDTVNFTQLTAPVGSSDSLIGFPGTMTDAYPESAVGGYDAQLIPGSNLTNWKLKLFTSAGTELAAGAYPAALLNIAGAIVLNITGPKGKI